MAAKYHAATEQDGWQLQDYSGKLNTTVDIKWQWILHTHRDIQACPYNDGKKFIFQKNPHYAQVGDLPEIHPNKITKAGLRFRVMTCNALSLNDKQGVLPKVSKGRRLVK